MATGGCARCPLEAPPLTPLISAESAGNAAVVWKTITSCAIASLRTTVRIACVRASTSVEA
jgi:hypothetical protein